MPTPEALRMAEIVSEHAPALKARGFRKRRHCFNRTTSDGLVHVVNFWQAPKEPPAWTEVPGLRERLYGSFRLDFGVYVPEMTRMQSPKTAWINEYNCEIGRTIGALIGMPYDMWWPLSDPEISSTVAHALDQYGIPWLDSLPDREAILRAYHRDGYAALGMAPASPLDIADLLRGMGRADESRKVLIDYIRTSSQSADYLAEYLELRGEQDLVPMIHTERPSAT